MAVFYGLCLALMLVMRFAPLTPLGRWLNCRLVERPLARLAALERHHLIFFVVLMGFAIGGGEAVAVLGAEVVTGYALDLAIYFDAVLVTYALATVATVKRGAGWLRHAVVRYARPARPRSKRTRPTAVRPRKSANDDDPVPVLLAA